MDGQKPIKIEADYLSEFYTFALINDFYNRINSNAATDYPFISNFSEFRVLNLSLLMQVVAQTIVIGAASLNQSFSLIQYSWGDTYYLIMMFFSIYMVPFGFALTLVTPLNFYKSIFNSRWTVLITFMSVSSVIVTIVVLRYLKETTISIDLTKISLLVGCSILFLDVILYFYWKNSLLDSISFRKFLAEQQIDFIQSIRLRDFILSTRNESKAANQSKTILLINYYFPLIRILTIIVRYLKFSRFKSEPVLILSHLTLTKVPRFGVNGNYIRYFDLKHNNITKIMSTDFQGNKGLLLDLRYNPLNFNDDLFFQTLDYKYILVTEYQGLDETLRSEFELYGQIDGIDLPIPKEIDDHGMPYAIYVKERENLPPVYLVVYPKENQRG